MSTPLRFGLARRVAARSRRVGPSGRALILAALSGSALMGCGQSDASTATTAAAQVSTTLTVPGVGRLPDAGVEVTVPLRTLNDPVRLPAYEGPTIATQVEGNRLLMIGDSIFAGLSTRHGGEACRQLTEIGWQVSVEAESGRFADFGQTVVATRRSEGWDAAAVFLGSNYDGNEERYRRSMERILDGLGDMPVILVTTTPFRMMQDEVNEVVRSLGADRDNVRVLEWAALSTLDGMLSGDGLHPSVDGQTVLVAAIAQILGAFPDDGACLTSYFVDDSANPEGPRSGRTSASTSATTSSTSSATNSPATNSPASGSTTSAGTSPSPSTSLDGNDGDPADSDGESNTPDGTEGDSEESDGLDDPTDVDDTNPDDIGEPEMTEPGTTTTIASPTTAPSTTVATSTEPVTTSEADPTPSDSASPVPSAPEEGA